MTIEEKIAETMEAIDDFIAVAMVDAEVMWRDLGATDEELQAALTQQREECSARRRDVLELARAIFETGHRVQ